MEVQVVVKPPCVVAVRGDLELSITHRNLPLWDVVLHWQSVCASRRVPRVVGETADVVALDRGDDTFRAMLHADRKLCVPVLVIPVRVKPCTDSAQCRIARLDLSDSVSLSGRSLLLGLLQSCLRV